MGELRKDYVLDRWVVISQDRAKRPQEIKEVKSVGDCPFCPGNEKVTGEGGSVVKDGKWQIRWFENNFPSFTQKDFSLKKDRFYTSAHAHGHSEVIVETPSHDKQLADFDSEKLEELLQVYARRISALEKLPGVKYVSVFKNHGFFGGASVSHSHSQAIGVPFVPPEIESKLSAVRKFLRCPYCSIIESERTSGRFCFENDDFVAFAPYASRFAYEAWIFPKLHLSRFEEIKFTGLAEVLSKLLKKVKQLGLDYDIVFNYAPVGQDLHFHVELIPRNSEMVSGFEFGTGIMVNAVSPEDAASFYRE